MTIFIQNLLSNSCVCKIVQTHLAINLNIDLKYLQNTARDRFPSTSSTEDEQTEVEQLMLHPDVEEDGMDHMEGMEIMHQEEEDEEEEDDGQGIIHNVKYEQEGEHDESHGKYYLLYSLFDMYILVTKLIAVLFIK